MNFRRRARLFGNFIVTRCKLVRLRDRKAAISGAIRVLFNGEFCSKCEAFLFWGRTKKMVDEGRLTVIASIKNNAWLVKVRGMMRDNTDAYPMGPSTFVSFVNR